MKRCTFVDNSGWYANIGGSSCVRGEAIDRLAAYENTGFQPHEIAEMKKEYASVVMDLKKLEENYRTAIKDIEWASKSYGFCKLCSGGLSGNRNCVHRGYENRKFCDDCMACRCVMCNKMSEWHYNYPNLEE